MNDFDLRKYLKNNLLLESKEHEEDEEEVNADQDNDSYDVPYVDGKPVEEELTPAVLQPINAQVKDVPTLANAVLVFVRKLMKQEAFKLDSSSELKLIVDKLTNLAAKATGGIDPEAEAEIAAEPKIAAEGANIRAHDEMNAGASRDVKLIKIANELFPDIAKKQDGGKLINFIPLDILQRKQVYQKYTEGSTKIKENDYASNPNTDPRTEQIIQMLKDMDIDGETMEYILIKVGMDDQMANQLVNNPAEYEDEVSRAVGESRELRKMAEQELHADSNAMHVNDKEVDESSIQIALDNKAAPYIAFANDTEGNPLSGDDMIALDKTPEAQEYLANMVIGVEGTWKRGTSSDDDEEDEYEPNMTYAKDL